MEDKEYPSPDYIKGFNYGYIIANIPGLADQLSKNDATSGKFLGVKHGIAQYQREMEQNRKPDWLKSEQKRFEGRTNNTKGKAKDDLEKE